MLYRLVIDLPIVDGLTDGSPKEGQSIEPARAALASRLIKEIGFEPVVVGGLAMGKYLVPRTPLGGVHTPDEIKQIAATLK